MAAKAEAAPEPRLLFTAPWEPVVIRRGDALGLRALADQFAEAIAPNLTNRVRDGRWVTILAWCLARSQQAFHASGGRSVETRDQERERYAWLRPLELMWVARTIALTPEDWRTRSLAGQRRVRPWYQDENKQTDRFGLTIDQFHAYRQTGMYGGYRLAFRKWPGMTHRGDGWTPGPGTHRLAKWLDDKLGAAARPSWSLHAADAATDLRIRGARGEEDRWWLRRWSTFDHPSGNIEHTLPRAKNDFTKLPEAHLLEPLVFGSDPSGSRRLKVAREVARAGATQHIEVCDYLGRAFGSDRTIALLPRFARLADAGMAAMDLIAERLRRESQVPLADIAALPDAKPICEELMAAAHEWLKGAQMPTGHIEAAHRFANSITSARPSECLGALLQYHEVYGGGLRWFVLRGNQIEPRVPPRAGTSRYRFRLWSLCRLATQVGVLRDMPEAVREDVDPDEDDVVDAIGE